MQVCARELVTAVPMDFCLAFRGQSLRVEGSGPFGFGCFVVGVLLFGLFLVVI